jgi:hypothetical protein
MEPPELEAIDCGKTFPTQALFQVFASADIEKGAELLADYGPTYFQRVLYAD